MQFRLSTLMLLFVVLWSSLAVFGAWWGVGVFIAVVALAICVQKIEPIAVESSSIWIIVVAILCFLFLISLLLPSVQSCREAAPRAQCLNNMHNIALALLNYEAKYHRFPPAF